MRGTTLNPTGRFERLVIEPEPGADDERGAVPTIYYRDASRSLIATNDSPDLPYTYSINPYRGCEHGCVYCYARPYHEYLGLSAGLDFESKIFVKDRAPELLRAELRRRSWTGEPLSMSGVTDPYQPVERRLQITRRCLEILADCRQPVGLITKSVLVARDADVLGTLARVHAAHVLITIPTLNEALRRTLEPRAPTPAARLQAISRLADGGVPVGVMVSPVIPGMTEHELPRILREAKAAGASFAFYTLLRLPGAVRGLFEAWLEERYPSRREKVMGRLAEVHDGCVNGTRFFARWRGQGVIADLVGRLFEASRERAGLAARSPRLRSDGFRRPARAMPLFEEEPPISGQ